MGVTGLENKHTVRKGAELRMTSLSLNRFNRQGIKGLLKYECRTRHSYSITVELAVTLIEKTSQGVPANATHRSNYTMAKEKGIFKDSGSRIWRARGLKLRRTDDFIVSKDPHFTEKLEYVIGLYLNLPEHALALPVGEKSRMQALDRTKLGLSIMKGGGKAITLGYKRNGTISLFAALNTANGEVYGFCQEKHRHQEWLGSCA
jgi:hypothetical protein